MMMTYAGSRRVISVFAGRGQNVARDHTFFCTRAGGKGAVNATVYVRSSTLNHLRDRTSSGAARMGEKCTHPTPGADRQRMNHLHPILATLLGNGSLLGILADMWATAGRESDLPLPEE